MSAEATAEEHRSPDPIRSLAPIMTVSEVGQVLGRSDETVCAYIRRGELVASGLGTDKRGRPCAPYAVFADELIAFLRRRQLPADQGLARPTTESAPEANRAGRQRRSTKRGRQLVTPRSPR